jgi:hypothetical protein
LNGFEPPDLNDNAANSRDEFRPRKKVSVRNLGIQLCGRGPDKCSSVAGIYLNGSKEIGIDPRSSVPADTAQGFRSPSG